MSKSDPHFVLQERFLDQPYGLAGRVIDPVSGTLSWQGKREHLRRKELEVLALLASAEGKQVSRENFIAEVWEGNDLVGDRGLSSTIGFLRRSLHDQDPDQPLIRTIPRRGYQLAVAVQEPTRASREETPAVLIPGGLIPECPDWRLVKRLNESASSDHWLAEPSEFGERDQGLRVFRFCRSESHLRLLQREVTLLRYLRDALGQNQHFALIRDWQLDEPPYFLARDYTRFGSLRHWGGLAEQSLDHRITMMQGLSDAVAAMHALGVVHRQLDADTILVDQSDSCPTLKISAFDLAALRDQSVLEPFKITAAGLTLGVAEGAAEPSFVGDVLALGQLLLQLALADLQAQASTENLEKIKNLQLRAIIARCCGPFALRPGATELAAEMRRLIAPSVSSGAAQSEVARIISLGTAKASSKPKLMDLPEQIGAYRLLDRLGEGGMGSVFLAEQRDPYRKVALKIIRSGLDGKQVLSRFEAERQALAMMNHPNVAMALDSGLAPDGRPFFAMEYVAGEDITTYCDARCLAINARIQLFLQVCDGVWHAHQKGVLHRDLKPSNLMVTQAQETFGTVKVIDFGLAKSLHGKLAAQTLHTSFGAFIGTPAYCSPEHISGAASGVDTRSDIYSLGVVLYELLAGSTPIANASLEQLEPEKVREVICRSTLPSMRQQVQSTPAEKRALIAEHRSSKMEDLPTTLDGDLSWVVGKCLERDPNDRYGSVLELKKDLERWLEFRPVEARPTSSWYRFRKLVRRNRAASFAVAAGLALITLSTTAAFVGYLQAKRALNNEKLANAEAKDALEFQVKQFESLDVGAMGVSLRHILTDGFNDYVLSLKLGPVAAEAMQRGMTDAMASMNFTDVVVEQLEKHYFEPSIQLVGEKYQQNPTLQEALWSSTAENLEKLGRYDATLALRNKILLQRQQRLSANDLLALDAQIQLGLAHFQTSENVKAKEILEEAVRRVLQFHGKHTELSFKARHALAQITNRSGDHEKAITMFRSAYSDAQSALGDSNPVTLQIQSNLGYLLVQNGEIAEAAPLIESAYERTLASMGPSHYETLIASASLAGLRSHQRRFGEAIEISQRALASVRDMYGSGNEAALLLMSNLAVILNQDERYPDALKVMRDLEALRIARGLERATAHSTLKWNLGAALLELGKLQASESYLIAAINATNSVSQLNATLRLAELRRTQGRFEEAGEIYQKVIDASLRLQDFNLPRLTYARAGLGLTLLAKGDRTAARAMLEQALADSHKVRLNQLAQTLKVQAMYALALPTTGPEPNALSILSEVVEQQQSTQGVLFIQRIKPLSDLARLLNDQAQPQQALVHSAMAIELGTKLFPDGHYLIAAALTQQGRALKALGQGEQAEAAFTRAQKLIIETEGLDPAYQRELTGAM